jgi:phospholipid/cholesterol/gamma-HCH transport system ATP-binding protein
MESSVTQTCNDIGAGLEQFASFHDVYKAFEDGNQVFQGLDFSVPRGELSVVIGGSGSGKSTLLRVLLGLEPYQRGRVELLGREVSGLSAAEHTQLMMNVGMLFQFGALFDSMTVYDNVGFALRYVLHRPEQEIRRVVRENLLLVGLKNVEHLYPSQLSGGMRKRVALARAIAHHPRLLLVDEPTTGLDPIMAETINELILQLHDRLGVTVLCITHDIHAAFKIATRISMLYQGRIIAAGTPDELQACEHEVVQQFLAGSAHGPITP